MKATTVKYIKQKKSNIQNIKNIYLIKYVYLCKYIFYEFSGKYLYIFFKYIRQMDFKSI